VTNGQASPALGGTRARRPKAEHAGRTTPDPPGGSNAFVPREVLKML